MSKQIELKQEVSKIITELNTVILKAKKVGINISVNTKAINDGTEYFYVGVIFTCTRNI